MTDPMDLANLRREFMTRPLRRSDLAPDPITQFRNWFSDALAASTLDPNAMSVATVGIDGQPSLRTVLLKSFDVRGFVFYTNLGSRKAQDIRHNPQVALLLYWAEIGRQVRITGKAVRTLASEDLDYFRSRPRTSQIGAWASAQSHAIDARDVLDGKYAEIEARFGTAEVPLPTFWGGYRVAAETMEFWQARASRLHDRFSYSVSADGWMMQRLAP